MHTKNDAVSAMVVRQLTANPKLDSNALYGFAKELDPTIAELTPVQFHGRYVLAFHRQKAVAEGRIKPRKRRKVHVRKATAAPEPAAIKQLLFSFATQVKSADSFEAVAKLLDTTTQSFITLYHH